MPLSSSSPSPKLTERTGAPSETISHRGGFTSSDTQLESVYGNDAEPEGRRTDFDVETEQSQDVLDVLDARLFHVLGNDPEVAAHLIPHIHAPLQLGLATRGTAYTEVPATSFDNNGGSDGNGVAGPSSLMPASETTQTALHQHNRSRERDESEEPRANGGSKRQKPNPDRSIRRPRNFACHFYKKDPEKYCPDGRKKCFSPSIPELRRIK